MRFIKTLFEDLNFVPEFGLDLGLDWWFECMMLMRVFTDMECKLFKDICF